METLTFEEITENREWLEDRASCSRYWITGEETAWVCNECEEIVDDPIEHQEECEYLL
ncbi:MAG: hypothetical protein IBX56_20035 [Methylomicrobium sp.]|nr:hypothetical protein [Methylomicrobium sp.]